MKEKKKLTIISFLSYFFIGSLVVITGIIVNKVSESFNYSIIDMSKIYTFLNLGILIGIVLNSWLIKNIKIKKQIILSFFLIINITILLFICNNIKLFSIIIFFYGLISGITMSIGTFLITILYKKKRSSMLLLTDSFFSIAGILFPLISTYIIKKNFSWCYIYLIISSIYTIIFLITIKTKFPQYKIFKEKKITKKKKKKNKKFFLLYLITFTYILGQLIFISWVPIYSMEIINLNIIQTGKLISSFWTSYMIGMWFFSIIIKYCNLKNMIIKLIFISTIAIFIFNNVHNYEFLKVTIITLGFFSSAIYTSLITLSSLETKKPSQKIINLTLTSGTIGTLLTFVISSPIVKKYGIQAALYTANILYFMVLNLLILFFILKN